MTISSKPLWTLLSNIADEEILASLKDPGYDQLARERRENVVNFFLDLADAIAPNDPSPLTDSSSPDELKAYGIWWGKQLIRSKLLDAAYEIDRASR